MTTYTIEVSNEIDEKLKHLQTIVKNKNMTIEELIVDLIDDVVDVWIEHRE